MCYTIVRHCFAYIHRTRVKHIQWMAQTNTRVLSADGIIKYLGVYMELITVSGGR